MSEKNRKGGGRRLKGARGRGALDKDPPYIRDDSTWRTGRHSNDEECETKNYPPCD